MITSDLSQLLLITDLLTNSIYVPSTGFDGSVVKAYAEDYRNIDLTANRPSI